MFRAVSQIAVTYRNSAISSAKVGALRAGDRLPWAHAPGADNFATFGSIRWQVHVYGTASQSLCDWCKSVGLSLHAFSWRDSYRKTGLARNAMYLLRPDTYIAFAASEQSPQLLKAYFLDHGFSLPDPSMSKEL
jgi:hypothetical protein